MTGNVKVDLKPLTDLLREMGGDYVTKVGIIGSKGGKAHEDSDLTVAEVGAVHELGSYSRNIPIRSFLRMPLMEKQDQLIAALDKGSVKEKFESGDIKGVYRSLGVAAEAIVQQAFATQGFGHWPSVKPETAKRKGSKSFLGTAHGILIAKGQLRSSVSSQVVKKGEK